MLLQVLQGLVDVTLHADPAEVVQMLLWVLDGRVLRLEVVLDVFRGLSVQVVAAVLALETDQVGRHRHVVRHPRFDVSNFTVIL